MQKIEQWWERWPAANIGMACGPVSGLCSLDMDGKSYEKLRKSLRLPEGGVFFTGNGAQLLFRPYDWERVQNWEADLDGDDVRLLCEGRYTILPPSLHANGKAYQWLDYSAHIETLDPSDWDLEALGVGPKKRKQPQPQPQPQPQRSFEDRLKHEHTARRAKAYLAQCEPAVSGQGGHSHTIKIVSKIVQGFGIAGEEALEVLAEWNDRCQPPWSEKELRHKISEAEKYQGLEFEALKRQTVNGNGHHNGHHNGHSGSILVEAAPPEEQKPTNRIAQIQLPKKPEKKIEIPNTIGALDLVQKKFEPLKWCVDNLLCEGVTILAGPPKVGKSWLVLSIALGIANGDQVLSHFKTQRGPVLYLALEDGERRLQTRLNRMLDYGGEAIEPPRLLSFATDWHKEHLGGLDALAEYCESNKPRLVIIDTLARFRPPTSRQAYEDDYAAIAGLQKLATEKQLAVLIVTHTRKSRGKQDEDVDHLETVTGTQGINGAADATWVLKRPRGQIEGALHVCGREIEERSWQMRFDSDLCLWSCTGILGAESGLSAEQKTILAALSEGPRGILDLASEIRKSYDATAKMLQRLKSSGLIERIGTGTYQLPTKEQQA